MKRSIKMVSRRLPPHSNEAWLPAHGGEAKKPLIIALIVIVGIIFLSLLLFSERLFVGKAFTGLPDTAGLVDPGIVTENQPFSMMIQANLANEPTTVINFTLQLPEGVSCANVAMTDLVLFNPNAILYMQCIASGDGVALQFTSGTYDIQDARSGTFNIVRLDFNGLPEGSYDFQFVNFDAINAIDPRQSNPRFDLITNGLGTVVSVVVQDTDGDGVADADDQCPNTPASEVANTNGCSVSQVPVTQVCGNNVREGTEQCDGTDLNGASCGSLLPGYSGTLSCDAGCTFEPNLCIPPPSSDLDNDGILDTNDQCPNTPASETADANGCSASQLPAQPEDTDNDGLFDTIDNCRTVSNPGQEDVDADGIGNACDTVAVDTDGDSVPDSIDQCPNTPVAEAANNDGCSPTQIAPTSGTFETTITANVAITEATVYTILKDASGRILVLKSEKMLNIPAGGEYVVSVAYPSASLVRSKEVYVQDRLPHQGWAVHGSLVVSDVNVVSQVYSSTGVGVTLQSGDSFAFGGCPQGSVSSTCVSNTNLQCEGSYGSQIVSCGPPGSCVGDYPRGRCI